MLMPVHTAASRTPTAARQARARAVALCTCILPLAQVCRCARPDARSRQRQRSKWGVASLDHSTPKVLFCLGSTNRHIVSPKVSIKSYR